MRASSEAKRANLELWNNSRRLLSTIYHID